MNGWNRLFVVVAACWALVVPFLVTTEVNRPVNTVLNLCATAAYENYGASDSRVRLDMDTYRSEKDKCFSAYGRDFVSIQKVAAAIVGLGDWMLGLAVWSLIVIPLAALWIMCWIVGRTARWVAAGFRR
jgi:hypothetical protein